jgi:hypothetical protein
MTDTNTDTNTDVRTAYEVRFNELFSKYQHEGIINDMVDNGWVGEWGELNDEDKAISYIAKQMDCDSDDAIALLEIDTEYMQEYGYNK